MRKRTFAILVISFFLFSVLRVEATDTKKDTWRKETIYYLMVDRFNNGDFENDFTVQAGDPKSYHGGDFEGIILQLDYIKDMGFTTIALSPIFDNEENGYHGYWIKDFYKVEEHFGSLATFKKLVNEAHKRDMKVMIDFVGNSVGPNHPWVKDASKQDWFQKTTVDGKSEPEKSWTVDLPNLNLENSEVKTYLIDVAKWWVKETKIDGYKLENMQHPPSDFLDELSQEVKKINPEFFLLGDVKASIPDEVKPYMYKDMDGLLDYPSSKELRSVFAKPDQSMSGVFSLKDTYEELSDTPIMLGTFMDNQWSERFTRGAVQNNLHPGARWKLALTYLYTTPGIPIVYYGSEIALDGGLGDDNLRQMDFRTDKELVEYITKLGNLRNQLPSLTNGTFELLYDKDGMTVFKREFEGETSVIAINNTSKSQNITLSEEQVKGDKELRGLLNEDLVKSKNGEYALILDRDLAEVYYLANKSGLNLPLISAVTAVYIAFAAFVYLLIKRRKRTE
jgi:glycosidase